MRDERRTTNGHEPTRMRLPGSDLTVDFAEEPPVFGRAVPLTKSVEKIYALASLIRGFRGEVGLI